VAVAAVAVAAADAVGAGAEMMPASQDRVGIGWRPELAAGILEHLDEINAIEVLADDFFDAHDREIRALKTLASQVPVMLHGVAMGLAASSPVSERFIKPMAWLYERIRPESWSEHLAFVRAGGIEIGHLAAPPRTLQNVECASQNIRRAAEIVGAKPSMENIATLIVPPGSELPESAWTAAILEAADCDLLLDLHNVLANGSNHSYNPASFLNEIPSERIRGIHIAGGRFISAPDGRSRLLDDHLHDVPDPVFDLLQQTAATCPNPLTVILERDGAYPPIPELLGQLRRARLALTRGRAQQKVPLGMPV